MKKRDFFLLAMHAQEYRRTAWVVSAFAQIYEGPEAWKADPYPYRIVQTPTGIFYVDADNTANLIALEDATPGAAPFAFKDKVDLKAGDLPNLHEDLQSNYGNLLFNWICVVYPFGTKIDYLRGRVSPRQLEKLVLSRYKENPENGVRDEKAIYTDEWLRLANAAFHLENFSQLCVPAGSERAMVTHPGMKELRDRLYEENKERLHDPSVVADIVSKLGALDKEWLKDDEDAMGFLIKEKSFATVRRKLFTTMGSEAGLEDSVRVEPIKAPLSEGWDIDSFAALNNTLRAGSFNRGAQTMLGGEQVKWLLRASSNLRVAGKDCGSRIGNQVTVTADTLNKYIGFSAILSEGIEKLEKENIGNYIGKTIRIRSPMFCQYEKTDFCETCIGDRLSLNPTALFSAISNIGSTMLLLFMASAHSKPITVAKMEYLESIG